MSPTDRPIAWACTRSTLSCSCGAFSRVFGRTPTRVLSAPAFCSSVLRAASSAASPAPLRSCSHMSKPPNWPRPCTVGRLTTKICAPLMPYSAPLACWMKSVTTTLRSSQGLSLMNAMPTFSPWPRKLKPATCIIPSKPSIWLRVPRIWVNTSLVLLMVLPGGSCTIASA